MSVLGARVARLEAAAGIGQRSCPTCRDWPDFITCIVRLVEGERDPWHPWVGEGRDVRCPDCGAEPKRPRVPLWLQIVEAGD